MTKVAVLLENRFLDQEIVYYQHRFAEAGIDVDFLTRLWGQPSLTFTGLELGLKVEVDKSFENLDDDALDEYGAVIVPSGYVADQLLYAEKPGDLSPAAQLVQRLMGRPHILKAAICHSLWLWTPIPQHLNGRRVTCHNNVVGSVTNTGAVYTDQDIVVDGDLVTARTGGMFAGLAKTVIERLATIETKDLN
ncbi:ThiJ/PfpI domain protein [Xylanimonas cellulosilytica DSM 15894]|uniref:ThiJ/PfpI domain protein n=1 Tax=Xylanimonas cellulosilytica (strain DSM 15894 / JCM 12276 / CECT 5975 / KCTC 9989 / LMG 20990 / NBRC 107835 / XIL07) TaxID=446471 RepID=D1BYK3_XYLCX|nr:DJ-1/PfpI family protein [Xylanimonas cellulosilytica]ACZ31875.1 ThiJ/PfpI domain protein [Xylanimonas cellulosilytica DSM 15894]